MEDIEFYKLKHSVNVFKNNLKLLILKHNVTLSNECEYISSEDDCDGIGTDISYIKINGQEWLSESLSEIITECFNTNDDIEDDKEINPSIDYIADVVCEAYDIDKVKMFIYTGRKTEYREPKQVIQYLARKYTKLTCDEIGWYFLKSYGGKEYDHSTILHSTKVIKNYFDTDKIFRSFLNGLIKKLGYDSSTCV